MLLLRRHKLFLAVFFPAFLFPYHGESQNLHNVFESLRYVVTHSNDDTTKVNALNLIANYHWRMGEFQESTDSANLAIQLASKLEFKKGERDGYDNLAEIAFYKKEYDRAVDFYQKTIDISSNIHDTSGIAYGYRQLGWHNMALGISDKALMYLDSSYKFNEAIQDSAAMKEILGLQVTVYLNSNEVKKAKDLFEKTSKFENIKGVSTPGFANRAYLSNLYAKEGLTDVSAQHANQRRKMAYIAIAFVILSSMLFLWWYRKKKITENQLALMSERLRISRDLHDEVGATLSGIVMYSHLAKNHEEQKGQEKNQYLDVVQSSASDMVNKLSDIVWLVNPGHDSFQNVIERLEEYGNQITSAKNIHFECNVEAYMEHQEVPIEARKNIYLFCKEALNNAVKYSGAHYIGLKFEQEEKKTKITISDDGLGFDLESIKRGNGISSMEQRASDLGAQLSIESANGAGTRITLSYIL